MAKTTADTARARLFAAPTPRPPAEAPAPPPTPEKAKAQSGEALRRTAAETSRPAPASKRAGRDRATPAKAASEAPAQATGTSNYLGGGLYAYKGRTARKLSVYVSPDLVPALKSAGASGKDPRGNDMSEIVETLIREAGYGDG